MTQVTQVPSTLWSRFADAQARFQEVDNERYTAAVEAGIYLAGLQRTDYWEVVRLCREVGIDTTNRSNKAALVDALYQMKRNAYNLPELEAQTEAHYKTASALYAQLPDMR